MKKSTYSYENTEIKPTITINGPEDRDEYHDSNGELNFNGLLKVLGDLTRKDKVAERIRLGNLRDEIKARNGTKDGNRNVTNCEDEDDIWFDGCDDTNTDADSEIEGNGEIKAPNLPRVREWLLYEGSEVIATANAESGNITQFANGYAVYEKDDTHKTILWTPELKDFKFKKLREEVRAGYNIPDIGREAWYIYITVCGDYQIDNIVQKKKINKKIDTKNTVEGVNDNTESVDNNHGGTTGIIKNHALDPYDELLLNESILQEIASKLDGREMNILLFYYAYYFLISEIAACIGITRQRAGTIMKKAKGKLHFVEQYYLAYTPSLADYCEPYVDGYLLKKLMDRYSGSKGITVNKNGEYVPANCRPAIKIPLPENAFEEYLKYMENF